MSDALFLLMRLVCFYDDCFPPCLVHVFEHYLKLVRDDVSRKKNSHEKLYEGSAFLDFLRFLSYSNLLPMTSEARESNRQSMAVGYHVRSIIKTILDYQGYFLMCMRLDVLQIFLSFCNQLFR